MPNFTDSERFKTPKTDCELEVKEFYQLGFQVCWPWKFRVTCYLNMRIKTYAAVTNKLACTSTPHKVNVWLTTTPDMQLQHYSQRYLALPIRSSRLNAKNAPGTRPYCNCQPLRKILWIERSQKYLHELPCSRKLSREKTFVNFEVL